MTGFAARGWQVFDPDPPMLAWAGAALPVAARAMDDPVMRAKWLVCEDTWFVGVDALGNAPDGSVGGVALEGHALTPLRARNWPLTGLHKAQVSAVWPGYPRPRDGESEAAFGYRLRRDAAHVDGLRAEGADRRRYLREPHAYILGVALSAPHSDAAPLVVWEGSHLIVAEAFSRLAAAEGRRDVCALDLTDVYTQTRARIFRECKRVELALPVGAAVLVHRLCLHGVGPWAAPEHVTAPRIMAYFRPELADPARWQSLDDLETTDRLSD